MNGFHPIISCYIWRLASNNFAQKQDVGNRMKKLWMLFKLSNFSSVAESKTTCFTQMSTLVPPPHVRGMTVLDRENFQIDVEVPYLNVPINSMKTTLKTIKPHLLKLRKLNPVIDESADCRKILLHPEKLNDSLLKDIAYTKVHLQYDNWSSEDIFKAVLPEDSVGNVSSFSIIGHIIHLNLKAELLNYKYLIGQVLLDKYPNIKTVVNKCETIDNTFRNFKMEHLAGESNYQVIVKEYNFQYAFDFDKVFWNPRLGSERNLMTKSMNSGDLVYDVFAGVGPFAIPMARKGCNVHANDLNPDSYKWLCHNAKLNKVGSCLKTYNLDGSDFILKVIKPGLIEYFNNEDGICNVHIIMNLPAIALTFLEKFDGLLAKETVENIKKLPTVHCYFFKKKDEEVESILCNYLKADLLKKVEITTVRVVAPNKLMMKVSYELPKEDLFNNNSVCEPLTKRFKLTDENNT